MRRRLRTPGRTLLREYAYEGGWYERPRELPTYWVIDHQRFIHRYTGTDVALDVEQCTNGPGQLMLRLHPTSAGRAGDGWLWPDVEHLPALVQALTDEDPALVVVPGRRAYRVRGGDDHVRIEQLRDRERLDVLVSSIDVPRAYVPALVVDLSDIHAAYAGLPDESRRRLRESDHQRRAGVVERIMWIVDEEPVFETVQEPHAPVPLERHLHGRRRAPG